MDRFIDWFLDKALFWILGIPVALVGIFVIFTLCFITPIQLMAEAKCMKKGYPEAAVTVTLDVYCKSYGGAVYPIVDPSK